MDLELFLVATPGLEAPLADEARDLGFAPAEILPGGVMVRGGWPEIVRANTHLRGATRVLARVAQFRAMHPAQLDKRSRKVDWGFWLNPECTVRVDAVCRKSRIYHAGAARTRVERAIADATGCRVAKDADLAVKVRIEDDLCTISIDTSGESLHRRGHKQAVGKAPIRETMAAMLLRQCGFVGTVPVLDPMCGSGTFVIEAAEIAMGLAPGRARNFAFEKFAGYAPAGTAATPFKQTAAHGPVRFFGSDRDAGAVDMSLRNAKRAGVANICGFTHRPVSEIAPPCDDPGLVIVNPPYGDRIGKKGPLYGLYSALGQRLASEFQGWRVGIVTSEPGLAKATGLDLEPPGPVVAHGGLKVRLWQARLPSQ